ncbi:putative RNA methyltransferase [Natronoglycomyces albus]|uniref:rRNA (Guanine-N1)-methyltransferase n=1 Tax=Natronoglycomyces albus TaxID=2811108 RepID=A0A895XMW9_9ACTN|nr:hypothetical protein [Natronoglycomyces albus]QSB04375.1 rRNA (guanine-N1)-methyltransferase [Natronoglycomyces albus]
MSNFPPDAVASLWCPHCRAPLALRERRLSCADGHSFDLAKQGYAPLLTGRGNTTTGDTADQVAARESFLATGAYEQLREAVATASRTTAPGCVVEPGCGTGYYLAATLEEQLDSSEPDSNQTRLGIGLDTSKYALRRAARAHPRIAAVLADAWDHLPLRTGSAACVLNVFAPRNGAEIARILHPEGHLVVVTPQPHHLHQLVERLDMLTVDLDKESRVEKSLGQWFHRLNTETIDYWATWPLAYIESLVLMGPSARHLDIGKLRSQLNRHSEPWKITVAVTVSIWKT